LKRKYPHLKWVADYRDLHIEPIYKNTVLTGLQRKVEKRLLAKADLVTSISDGLTAQLKANDRPTATVLRGVELRAPEEQFEKFTLAYTGSLYFDYRDPRPVFTRMDCLVYLLTMD